ncbi:MAG: NnrU family protein [Alphaproteobacteria bacterium]|nr:NnrU family protein [Alphaproteobacteria bacterium]
MTMLIAAAAVFIGIHLLISGTRLRDAITGLIGEGAYLGLFSLASIAAIAWLVMSYNAAQAGADDPILYTPWTGLRHLAIPVVAIAFLLAVPGLLMPNPTSLKQEGAAAKEGTVRGVLCITRHPFLWGVAIWSAFHTAANGDEASVIFFGTFFLVSFFGTFSIDAKRRRTMGAAWDAFAARTSNVPFARGGIRIGELFDWRLAVAVAVFLSVLFSHARLFGVSPFPGGWVPY